MNNKEKFITFADIKLENEFESLQTGKFEDKKLYSFINRAIEDLKIHNCGIKIPRNLWPKIYLQKYSITNLWKYDLPNGWRLIYTIKEEELRIINIILEWFNHKGYENRFGY